MGKATGGSSRKFNRKEKRKRYYARHPEKQHRAAKARGFIK